MWHRGYLALILPLLTSPVTWVTSSKLQPQYSGFPLNDWLFPSSVLKSDLPPHYWGHSPFTHPPSPAKISVAFCYLIVLISLNDTLASSKLSKLFEGKDWASLSSRTYRKCQINACWNHLAISLRKRLLLLKETSVCLDCLKTENLLGKESIPWWHFWWHWSQRIFKNHVPGTHRSIILYGFASGPTFTDCFFLPDYGNRAVSPPAGATVCPLLLCHRAQLQRLRPWPESHWVREYQTRHRHVFS